MKYGQFGGPEHSPLGLTLLGYQDWLEAHHWPHTPSRFRSWAEQEYLISSVPSPRVAARSRTGAVAHGTIEPVIAR